MPVSALSFPKVGAFPADPTDLPPKLRPDSSSNSPKYSFQTPRAYASRAQSLAHRNQHESPFFTLLISRCAMPSSGGLMKSSAELMYITGALIFSSCGDGS